MKPYSEYSAEELAMESLFIRWVRYPEDAPIRKFWINWVESHPDRAETVRQARQLVSAVSEWEMEEVSAQESGTLWGRIRNTIEALPEIDQLKPSLKAMATNWYFLRWSVGIVATVGLILLWFFGEPVALSSRPTEQSIAKTDTTQRFGEQDSTAKDTPF